MIRAPGHMEASGSVHPPEVHERVVSQRLDQGTDPGLGVL